MPEILNAEFIPFADQKFGLFNQKVKVRRMEVAGFDVGNAFLVAALFKENACIMHLQIGVVWKFF